jgi:hypothetical protein
MIPNGSGSSPTSATMAPGGLAEALAWRPGGSAQTSGGAS